jgi:dynein assembly factor 1, axonemal
MASESKTDSWALLHARRVARARKVDPDLGFPVMTSERLRVSCIENDGFETPELNDKLYLHFTGYRRIEGLEEYTGVKALWLESNGLQRIENLGHMSELRCLFLQDNLIEKIENLASLSQLVSLNLSGNRLFKLEGLEALPALQTLNVAKNALDSAAAVEHLAECLSLATLDLSDNALPADDQNSVLTVLKRMPKLNSCVTSPAFSLSDPYPHTRSPPPSLLPQAVSQGEPNGA